MADPIPRPRDWLLEELRRTSNSRLMRLDELVTALLRVDALDQRITVLVDELALHHHQGVR